MLQMRLALVPMICLVLSLGCNKPQQSPDVSNDISRSLDQVGLKGVSVSQDRDKGVVTLKGEVASDADKAQAESIAKSEAAGQVVANEIGVRPPGDTVAGEVDSTLDKGIKNNLDAKLTQARLDKDVDYSVKNGVVTLSGDVSSQPQRTRVADLAKSVPNVKQVVNELQIKDQKATTTH